MAVQFLFYKDYNNELPVTDLLAAFWEMNPPSSKKQLGFVEDLIYGVLKNQPELDALIESRCTNWSMDRLAKVDVNVLRVGAYELLYCPDIPAVVAINEAVEVAKALSNFESGRFVNAVLDRIRKDLAQNDPKDIAQTGS